jgi:hypothetical protein
VFRERFDGKVIKTPKQMRNALRHVLLNHHKHTLENDGELIDGLDSHSSSPPPRGSFARAGANTGPSPPPGCDDVHVSSAREHAARFRAQHLERSEWRIFALSRSWKRPGRGFEGLAGRLR